MSGGRKSWSKAHIPKAKNQNGRRLTNREGRSRRKAGSRTGCCKNAVNYRTERYLAMKVESITLQKFKLFDNLAVSFKNKTLDEVSNRFLVLGDNGTGKTTLLQAVALPLAIATHQIRSVAEFDWIGFMPGRYARWGRPRIELLVSFTDEEIAATQEVARRWYEAQSADYKAGHPYVERGKSRVVRLILDGENCSASSMSEFFQFQGRYNALGLLRTDPSVRPLFSKLPGLFWFDQFRNLGSGPLPENSERATEGRGRISFDLGIGRLRRYLNG